MAKDGFPTIDEAASILGEFINSNPYSNVNTLNDGMAGIEVSNPWGDSSLSFVVTEDNDFLPLADALNQLVLPKRFSAIWHKDLKKLEIIWTAFKLPEEQHEIFHRKFIFTFNNENHNCEFALSSDRLKIIAKYARPNTISNTNHRNLSSFSTLANSKTENNKNIDIAKSFWIDNIEWNEDDVLLIIDHLNFYMRYFDSITPLVAIHPSDVEKITSIKNRYVCGKFPPHINSELLDENLLSFWSFAQADHQFLQFLLYYRIIEYCASNYINDDIRSKLKKILISPNLKGDTDQNIDSIVGHVAASKLPDSQKIRALFRKVVNPEIIWKDIKNNIDFFATDTNFEGGYTVRACVGKKHTLDTFTPKGVEDIADRFREIRNALSHGKDQESTGVIRPTPKNINLFRPWVHLIATAAGEVVIYKGLA